MKTTFSGWRYLWKSEDIRSKLLITLMILTLYRFAANVPAPGVNSDVLAEFNSSTTGSGNFLGFLDLLSGGTVSNFSLLAMGVYPYITAQIILQLLIPIFPHCSVEWKRIHGKHVNGRKMDITLPFLWLRFLRLARSNILTRCH
jgi:preprotein translocase subunit SecY